MSDETKAPVAAADNTKPDAKPAAKKKFNLQVKDLQLKQAPMEAVINRET